jgi:putative phosphoribosyl transferase
VRKLGVPTQPELAMGALGEGDVLVLDDGILAAAGVTDEQLRAVIDAERHELQRRARHYRDFTQTSDAEVLAALGR